MAVFTCSKALMTLLVVLASTLTTVESVLQTIALDVALKDDAEASKHVSMLASQAFYGTLPDMDPEKNPTLILTTSPDSNHFLCDVDANSDFSFPRYSIVLVPRGVCTFQQKSLTAQRMGAMAVLVYGALEGRYTLNTTAHVNDTNYQYTENDIVWPVDKEDYDCDRGRAMLPANKVSFDPLPYNTNQNNPILSGENSLCMEYSHFHLKDCPSKSCLLVGPEKDGQIGACCAWDIPIWLYGDNSQTKQQVLIPSAYITMAQATELKQYLQDKAAVTVVMYSRWRPSYNVSSILIWALGVAVAALAAYLTADEYRHLIRKAIRARARRQTENDNDDQPQQQQPEPSAPPRHPDEVLELTAEHALVFIVMASTTLLVLFYFKIYGIVKVFYALGCSNAVSQIIIQPFLRRMMRKHGMRDTIVYRTGTEDFGDITWSDTVSFSLGFSLGLAWLVVAVTAQNPDEIAFFWITQNLFGACMCIMFMRVIRLNSVRVAAILLIVAFFYDIFFVFITPLIFKGKSVMITVATSGGPHKADDLWCEKYPDDPDCQGGNPLPMLLTIPRLFDYQGGSSLLGLGDIVLPGLLISFGARLDAAKSLLGVMGGGSGSLSTHCPEEHYFKLCGLCSGGYFLPLVIAYAVGLMMANTAVYLMEMGQPALLYLVPCCLGTLSFLGWRRNELLELWHGPKALKAADAILYGESYQDTNTHAPLPVEEGADVLAAPPSASEEEDGVALMDESRKS